MSRIALAIKYRPNNWDDVVEQGPIKVILTHQLDTNSVKSAYLFCGGAGTGKTTSARIFANEINKGQGNPIELDAASNNSVDDMRELINQAKTKSLDSEYKIFIVDECHMITVAGWNALLKLLEEPPAKSIFIFCTTDPQKIPKTILSRVQRYDFQRISQEGICRRLATICEYEELECVPNSNHPALEYIAKIADGGMRDAITLLDKCLAYSTDLTLENVIKALGTVDYQIMFNLNDAIFDNKAANMIELIENIHKSGKELKQFMKDYTNFVLDVCKFDVTGLYDFITIPRTYEKILKSYGDYEYNKCQELLKTLIKLNSDIKWESSPKSMIIATLFLECNKENK